jgi:hypothetical protein
MNLHLSREPRMVSLVEQDSVMPSHEPGSHLVGNAVSPAFVEDSRIGNTDDADIFPHLFLFPFQDAIRDLYRSQFKANVRLPWFT